jgi:esterase
MQLNFQRHGEGFPLIILHGLFGSLDNWQSVARHWSESFQTFTLDLRNHGRSPHSEDFNYAVMVEDVREFMAAQGLNSAHLLGHSMGGKVAMHFALKNPALVKKLVVIDMAPRAYPPSHETIFKALLALDLDSFRERAEIDKALVLSIPDNATRQFLLKNIKRNDAGAFEWKMNLPAIYKNYADVTGAIESARTFDRPTLFIRGGRSDYIKEGDEVLIRQLFPQAQIKTIPEAGHWVHADASIQLKQMVSDFLRSTET